MAARDAAALAMEREDGQSGRSVITAHGQIDLYSAPEFKTSLLAAVDAGATDIVVDLTDVDFMDSTGLGVLVGLNKRLRAFDGRLAIVSSDGTIRRLFEISGLADRFPLYDTRADVPPPG